MLLNRDNEGTFAYVDLPYIDRNQGHYGGYNEKHFKESLNALASMKGKFLLGSYPSEILTKYIKKYGWKTVHLDKMLTASNGATASKRRGTQSQF